MVVDPRPHMTNQPFLPEVLASSLPAAHHGAEDRIERVGACIFPPTLASVPPQRMEPGRPGREDHGPSPGQGHPGRPRSYLSPEARLPDGRTHRERTAAIVIALVRARCRADAVPDESKN
ncbi:hypothetical protein [Jidongwangia harbinensis]|uniref:hypothetical protein n=1 Tax=Jidongwangia harbinensis TaxID=2878561 RepID=UPI0035581B72